MDSENHAGRVSHCFQLFGNTVLQIRLTISIKIPTINGRAFWGIAHGSSTGGLFLGWLKAVLPAVVPGNANVETCQSYAANSITS